MMLRNRDEQEWDDEAEWGDEAQWSDEENDGWVDVEVEWGEEDSNDSGYDSF